MVVDGEVLLSAKVVFPLNLRIDAALKQLLPSNSSRTIGSSEQNRRHPRIVAAASICTIATERLCIQRLAVIAV